MPFNALLDACVLYPVYVRDTLLSMSLNAVQLSARAHLELLRRP